MNRLKRLPLAILVLFICLLIIAGVAAGNAKEAKESTKEAVQAISLRQEQAQIAQAQGQAQEQRPEIVESSRSGHRETLQPDKPTFVISDIELDQKYQEYLYNKCGSYSEKYFTILSMIQVESKGNPDATSKTRSDGSCDMGLVQMNSKYLESEQSRLGQEFDPYNPNDAIDYIFIRYDEEHNYWSDNGITDDTTLIKCICGSYNRGRAGYNKYIKSHGYDYYYTDRILETMDNLMK